MSELKQQKAKLTSDKNGELFQLKNELKVQLDLKGLLQSVSTVKNKLMRWVGNQNLVNEERDEVLKQDYNSKLTKTLTKIFNYQNLCFLQMKSSSQNRILSSYNSISSIETAESPQLVIDQSRRFPPQSPFQRNRKLKKGGSNIGLNSIELFQVNQAPQRYQSSRHIEIPHNNFVSQLPESKLNHVISSVPLGESIFDYSFGDDNFENRGDFFNIYSNNSPRQLKQNSIQEENLSESDSDEYNIWDNSQPNELGIDMEGNNEKQNALQFVQLFYIRSQLYQEAKIQKRCIIEEVEVVSNMCNKKPLDILKSSYLIDKIEKDHHLSLKKNAKQLANLSFQPQDSSFAKTTMNKITNSINSTQKNFRISQTNLFVSPNHKQKIAPVKIFSQEEIMSPPLVQRFPNRTNQQNNTQSKNNSRFGSHDATLIEHMNNHQFFINKIKIRDHKPISNQQQDLQSKKLSIKLHERNIHTGAKSQISKACINKMMKITSQKNFFDKIHYKEYLLKV